MMNGAPRFTAPRFQFDNDNDEPRAKLSPNKKNNFSSFVENKNNKIKDIYTKSTKLLEIENNYFER